MKYPTVKNFINGQFNAKGNWDKLKVISLVDGTLLSEVPILLSEDLDKAVVEAKEVLKACGRNPPNLRSGKEYCNKC